MNRSPSRLRCRMMSSLGWVFWTTSRPGSWAWVQIFCRMDPSKQVRRLVFHFGLATDNVLRLYPSFFDVPVEQGLLHLLLLAGPDHTSRCREVLVAVVSELGHVYAAVVDVKVSETPPIVTTVSVAVAADPDDV